MRGPLRARADTSKFQIARSIRECLMQASDFGAGFPEVEGIRVVSACCKERGKHLGVSEEGHKHLDALKFLILDILKCRTGLEAILGM